MLQPQLKTVEDLIRYLRCFPLKSEVFFKNPDRPGVQYHLRPHPDNESALSFPHEISFIAID